MICITRFYYKTGTHQNKAVPAGQWIPAVAGMTMFFYSNFLDIEKICYLRYNSL